MAETGNKLTDLIAREGIRGKHMAAPETQEAIEKLKANLRANADAKEKNISVQLKAKEAQLLRRYEELEKEITQKLAEREVALQDERARLHEEFASREGSFRRELANQEAALKEREKVFLSKGADLTERTAFLAVQKEAMSRDFAQHAIEHGEAMGDLKRQKEQFQAEFQIRMESKAGEYVDSALASLKKSEERFDTIGSVWSAAGFLVVLGGLVLGYILAIEGTKTVVANKDISWALMLFFAAKGAVLLGLVIAVARLCLKLARSYMHESLKNAERRHAINYGKFYLSVYGAGSDGAMIKDVFASWNIIGSSAFLETTDPTIRSNDIGAIINGIISKAQKLTDKGGTKD